jgi:hypothetical protein
MLQLSSSIRRDCVTFTPFRPPEMSNPLMTMFCEPKMLMAGWPWSAATTAAPAPSSWMVSRSR